MKVGRCLIAIILLLSLSGCSIIPKWGRIQKNSQIPLDSFRQESIKKSAKETDPRYKEYRYDFRSTVEGLPAADATFWLKINRNRTYQARAEFNVISPWAAIFKAAGRQQIKGRLVNGRFLTREMRGFFQVGKKKYEILVKYPRGGQSPVTTSYPPPRKRALTPVDKRLLKESYDIVSALLTLMAQYQKGGQSLACRQSLLTWDGFRLARIKLSPDKTNPNMCVAEFQRVGGFLKKFERQARGKKSIIYFRVDKRFALPLEISADTPFIKPSLTMTRINGTPLSYYYLPDNLKKTPFDGE
ncbi:MAG: hypothetical protein ACR2NY_00290 [Alphaproteobacteria bacterium]